TTSKSFTVTVTNAAPVVVVPGDQLMSAAQVKLTLPISVTDPDGPPPTVTTSALSELAYLDQTYGLYAQASYYTNYWGKQEKWLYGPNSTSFFLLPSGEFFQATNGQPTGPLLATLSPAVY